MPKRAMKPDDIQKMVFVGDPQISPDGSRVLFSKKTINQKNKYISNLCVVDGKGAVRQWTHGEHGAAHGRWSPDGGHIAFVSGREQEIPQIFLLATDGGEARKLTDLPEGSIGAFRWSPDGTKIAFSFRETAKERTKAAAKEREAKGLSTPPIELDDIWYRLDGDGYFAGQRYVLHVVEVETGKHSALLDSDALGNYSFDWAPNSKELAVAHSANKRPLSMPANDQIWRVTLSGKTSKLKGLPKGDKTAVRWSPDGKTIAYAGDVDESDPWGVRNVKLYLVSPDGGEPACLSGDTDYDLGAATLSDSKEAAFDAVLEWAPDSKSLYVQIGWHGETQLGQASISGGLKLLTSGHHAYGIGNVSADGKSIAVVHSDALHLPEVGILDGHGKKYRRLTGLNDKFHEEIKLSEPEEFWLDTTPNKDGSEAKVHGWVMKPIGYKQPKRYPAILEIHGGPHAQYGWTFFHEFQTLAAAGYVVVYTNPRGSKGYGEGHCAAIRGDWGNQDWDDIQAVTRWMQHQSYIHSGQMGIMGGSYGGYMTNWAVGHTNDFKAAITDRCVSNMVSMAGNSDFPFNKDGYFRGSAWGDIEAIRELWKQSPIAFFEHVKTPMLIIHSEGDLRCNIEQSEQVFTALQQAGVDSRFVRYPATTSHGMSRNGPPDLRIHRLNEIVAWWDKYLK